MHKKHLRLGIPHLFRPSDQFRGHPHAWEEGYRAGREAEGYAQKIKQKLQRFAECADDGEGVDIGREWLAALTTLGLLERSQRSPARWMMTETGERTLTTAPSVIAGDLIWSGMRPDMIKRAIEGM